MQKRGFEVTDEYGANPDRFERKVAKVLTTHFKSDIVMLRKTQSTSPDMLATRLNQIWEIKNIKGDSKHFGYERKTGCCIKIVGMI